VIESTKKGL